MSQPNDKGPFPLKVNGVDLESPSRTLSALEILEIAKKHGAMPGNPDQYLLQGDKGRYNLSDKVDLAEDSIFITVPNTPTPVA